MSADKALLQLHVGKYCIDSCNVGREFDRYLGVLTDNFKDEPNNQCRYMCNDHSFFFFFFKE